MRSIYVGVPIKVWAKGCALFNIIAKTKSISNHDRECFSNTKLLIHLSFDSLNIEQFLLKKAFCI